MSKDPKKLAKVKPRHYGAELVSLLNKRGEYGMYFSHEVYRDLPACKKPSDFEKLLVGSIYENVRVSKSPSRTLKSISDVQTRERYESLGNTDSGIEIFVVIPVICKELFGIARSGLQFIFSKVFALLERLSSRKPDRHN